MMRRKQTSFISSYKRLICFLLCLFLINGPALQIWGQENSPEAVENTADDHLLSGGEENNAAREYESDGNQTGINYENTDDPGRTDSGNGTLEEQNQEAEENSNTSNEELYGGSGTIIEEPDEDTGTSSEDPEENIGGDIESSTDEDDINLSELLDQPGDAPCDVSEIPLLLTAQNSRHSPGDKLELTIGFARQVESNTAQLTIFFDCELYAFQEFSPADGVSVLSRESGDNSMEFFFMIPDYQTQEYGTLTLRLLDDWPEAAGGNIHAQIYYVYRDAEGQKNTFFAEADYLVNLFSGVPGDIDGDGRVTLLDLSALIDAFGYDKQHEHWNFYRRFDFNQNDRIDIADISHVAGLIQTDGKELQKQGAVPSRSEVVLQEDEETPTRFEDEETLALPEYE